VKSEQAERRHSEEKYKICKEHDKQEVSRHRLVFLPCSPSVVEIVTFSSTAYGVHVI